MTGTDVPPEVFAETETLPRPPWTPTAPLLVMSNWLVEVTIGAAGPAFFFLPSASAPVNRASASAAQAASAPSAIAKVIGSESVRFTESLSLLTRHPSLGCAATVSKRPTPRPLKIQGAGAPVAESLQKEKTYFFFFFFFFFLTHLPFLSF